MSDVLVGFLQSHVVVLHIESQGLTETYFVMCLALFKQLQVDHLFK